MVLTFLFGMIFSQVSYAVGFGQIKLFSYLNEPFRAEIELLGVDEMAVESLQVQLAGSKDFVRAGMARPYFLTKLKFDVVRYEGQTLVYISSHQAVKHPFLDFLIELTWRDGRLIKGYTVLLDPLPSSEFGKKRPEPIAEILAKKNQVKKFVDESTDNFVILNSDPVAVEKIEPKVVPQVESKIEVKAESKVEPKVEPKIEPKVEPEIKTQVIPEPTVTAPSDQIKPPEEGSLFEDIVDSVKNESSSSLESETLESETLEPETLTFTEQPATVAVVPPASMEDTGSAHLLLDKYFKELVFTLIMAVALVVLGVKRWRGTKKQFAPKQERAESEDFSAQMNSSDDMDGYEHLDIDELESQLDANHLQQESQEEPDLDLTEPQPSPPAEILEEELVLDDIELPQTQTETEAVAQDLHDDLTLDTLPELDEISIEPVVEELGEESNDIPDDLAESFELLSEDNESSAPTDGNEEVGLKIDLAKQYLAAGDKQSAKSLLQEVLGLAGPNQKAEVQGLLATL